MNIIDPNSFFNRKKDTWVIIGSTAPFNLPEKDKPVVILIEDDYVYDPDLDFPYTRKAQLVTNEHTFLNIQWEFLDREKDDEHKFVPQFQTVIAWRYL